MYPIPGGSVAWSKAQASIWKDRVLKSEQIKKVYKDAGGDQKEVIGYIADPRRSGTLKALYGCETAHEKKPALVRLCKTVVLAASTPCFLSNKLCADAGVVQNKEAIRKYIKKNADRPHLDLEKEE